MVRYLRIAVTALSLTTCVLLIALWVRSYWKLDIVPVWSGVAVISGAGAIGIDSNQNQHLTLSTADFIAEVKSEWPSRVWGTFQASISPNHPYLIIPYWFAILPTSSLAILSSRVYQRRRFSLRTLLIAMTLVAVALGIVVVAV